MRNIINISLPPRMAQEVERAVKKGRYTTSSETVRHLLRLWNTHELAEGLGKSRKEFEAGKGKMLRSLRDLR